MLQYLKKGEVSRSLGGKAGHRGVGFFAVESYLAFFAFQGTNVTHLDGTDCKLKKESPLVVSEICHKSLVNPQSVLQGLVAGDHALALSQILVVVCVEFVGRSEVQIRHYKRTIW